MSELTPEQLRAMTKERLLKECLHKERYIVRLKNILRSQSEQISELKDRLNEREIPW